MNLFACCPGVCRIPFRLLVLVAVMAWGGLTQPVAAEKPKTPAGAKSKPEARSESAAPSRADQEAAVAAALKQPAVPPTGSGWKSLFDGKTLAGWKPTEFGGGGDVAVEDGHILVSMGAALSGFQWTNAMPTTQYEITLEAMKVDGNDFFCALTMPVGPSHCTLVVGGWGGSVVGISSVDGQDASENDTTKYLRFPKGRWFKIRAKVMPERIEAWIDEERLVDLDIKDRKISLRFGDIELSKPLGIATYQTTGAIRNIHLREIK